jgi:hypothetical protein
MQELELLGDYLVRLRQEKLQQAHAEALATAPALAVIQARAHEAELCNRIREAVKVLANDPGKFIQEFLT